MRTRRRRLVSNSLHSHIIMAHEIGIAIAKESIKLFLDRGTTTKTTSKTKGVSSF